MLSFLLSVLILGLWIMVWDHERRFARLEKRIEEIERFLVL